MVEIKKISDKEIIKNLLIEFDSFFTPSLSSQIVDLQKHSEKLSLYSINYLLVEKDKIIGFISFYANDFETKKAFVSLLCVKPDYQKMGYATLLVNKMIDNVKKDFIFVELEVYSNNIRAISFYKKNGFFEIEDKISKNKEKFIMRKFI